MVRRAFVVVVALTTLGCSASTAPSGSLRIRPAAPPAVWGTHPDPSRAVLGFAHAQVGKRYCWGGIGPDCFDCSGLVQAAWRSGGVELPRTADAQGRMLVDVPFDQIRAGDILWWPHHVGLYVGNGEMIDAYHSRAGVVRRRVAVPQRVLRVVVR